MLDDTRPWSPDEVVKAVARAYWRTVKAALAREGKKALTVRRTSREALRTSNARNGTGGA